MKKKLILLCSLMYAVVALAQTGKVGINTSTPQAMLHVKDSSVLFTGPDNLPETPGNPPISGGGTRMMWYPDKAAFRVGTVYNIAWDKDYVGNWSFASGLATAASGLASCAMGVSAFASGQSSMSMGFNTIASGYYSTAMGNRTYASGESSMAMGRETNARAFSSLTIGQFNDSIATSSPTAWIASDPVFIVGNGLSNSLRNNAITVLKNAKTGINTAAPQAGLHIVAVDNSFDQSIRLESSLGPASYCNILYDGSLKFRTYDATATYQWRDNTSNTRMTLTSAGNLSIDGVLTQNSDVRLKKNVTPLQNSLEKITKLNGYQYNWLDASRGNELQTGILAQEVEKQMPELVKTDIDGDNKAVNYSGLLPYLIESIKELKQQNDALKKEIELLKAKTK